MATTHNARTVRAPRGSTLTCRDWQAEAAMRMLMNNLDPDVAERPEDLVVYGGKGKAARNWECFDVMVETMKKLGPGETLLVQSGKPVGVFRALPGAPKVLIANANLVGRWQSWEVFNELDRKGLMMYGQMTAGSWIYIGSQGIIQGTYNTFVEAARQHYGGSLAGRWIFTGGLGGMGGAQPLAATMAGAVMLAVECRQSRIERRVKEGFLDRMTDSLDEALALVKDAVARKAPLSVGLLGNVAEVLPELVRRGERPDLLTDQTSAHDPSTGYLPAGWTVQDWEARQQSDPAVVTAAAKKSMAVYVRAAIELAKAGVPTFEYGNNIRQMAQDEGVADAFSYPGAIGQYIRPLFARGKGPFRWTALSGNPEDIYKTDAKVKELIPDDAALHRWLDMAAERVRFQGLPARICWVGMERARIGLAFNDMVASGELEAPVVIGRDQMDAGSVASPNRETEKMPDGSDAVADWPMLNALMNTASGATWVSIQAGGGVGIGYSQHAGMAIVCDGTPEAARAIELSLTNDPGTGVMRQADAGYGEAREEAVKHNLWLPMEGIGGPAG